MFSTLPNVGSSVPSGSQFASKLARPAMKFTNMWGEGKIFDWYKQQKQGSDASVTIKSLQVRVDRGHLPTGLFLFVHRTKFGTDSIDGPKPVILLLFSARQLRQHVDLRRTTFAMLTRSSLQRSRAQHLARSISICHQALTFRALPYTVPSPEEVVRGLRPHLDALSRSSTKNAVQTLRSLLVNVITSIRDEMGNSVKRGLPLVPRLVWGLPLGVMSFVLQQVLKIQLYMGLEDNMHKKAHEQLTEVCQTLLEDAWTKRDMTNSQVGQRLWIKELITDIKPALEAQLVCILWDVVVDIFASVHGNLDDQQEMKRLELSLGKRSYIKSRLFGDIQWVQAWNVSLKTAMLVTRDATRGKAQEIQASMSQQTGVVSYAQLHAQVFDVAFNSVRDASMDAARRVANEIHHPDPKRAEMWETIWRLWPRIWESAYKKSQEICIPMAEEVVEDVLSLVVEHVVNAVGDVQARKANILVLHRKSDQAISSTAELQTFIHDSIDYAFRPVAHNIPPIHEAMLRVWDRSRLLGELQ